MRNIKLLLIALILFVGSTANSQIRGPIDVQPNGVMNGITIQQHIPTKKVIPYEFVREADVVWSKRIWRTIDLREKLFITFII